MKLRNKLLKDNFIYAVGSIGLSAAAFLMVPLFTRLLSPDEYGVVNTYNAYLNIFGILIGLGVNVSIKNAKYEYKDSFNDFIGSVTIFSFFIFAAVLAVACLIDKSHVLLIVNSYAFFLFTFVSDKFLIEFKHNKALLFQYINTLSGIALSVVLINLFNDKAYGRILGNAVPTITFGMALFIAIARKAKFKKEYIRFALNISCPLLVYQISYLMLTQFDRVMINIFLGNFEAGIYSFVFNIGLILNIIYKALWNVWYPWFFKQMDEKNYTKIRPMVRYFIILFSLIAVSFISIYPELVTIMAPRSYWSVMDLVVPVAVAIYFFFLFGFPLSILTFYKKNVQLSIASAVTVVINILLNAALLPLLGYESAAFTSLLSFILLFAAGCISAAKLNTSKIYYVKELLLGAATVTMAAYIMFLLKELLILRLILTSALFIIVAIAFYKKGVFKNFKTN